MRFAKRVPPGGTSQRWKLVEELELGEPMEESLVSVETSGARRAQDRYHARSGRKGSGVRCLKEGEPQGELEIGWTSKQDEASTNETEALGAACRAGGFFFFGRLLGELRPPRFCADLVTQDSNVAVQVPDSR